MVTISDWLQSATRGLSRQAAAQVRAEIVAHVEASIADGTMTAEDAILRLGDAKEANRQYREVMLTRWEARLLSETLSESRLLCSRPWLPMLIASIPVALFAAAVWFFLNEDLRLARVFSAGSVVMALLLAAPWLPLYTPARSRMYRAMKWTGMALGLAVAFGPEAGRSAWLLVPCAWPVIWIEWTRISIRRKLRVEDWPKALYL